MPAVFGHFYKVRKDVWVLRNLCSDKGRAPRVEDHTSENEIGEAQRVQRDVTRRSGRKARLEVYVDARVKDATCSSSA